MPSTADHGHLTPQRLRCLLVCGAARLTAFILVTHSNSVTGLNSTQHTAPKGDTCMVSATTIYTEMPVVMLCSMTVHTNLHHNRTTERIAALPAGTAAKAGTQSSASIAYTAGRCNIPHSRSHVVMHTHIHAFTHRTFLQILPDGTGTTAFSFSTKRPSLQPATIAYLRARWCVQERRASLRCQPRLPSMLPRPEQRRPALPRTRSRHGRGLPHLPPAQQQRALYTHSPRRL